MCACVCVCVCACVILSQFGLKIHVQLAVVGHFRLTARAMSEENQEVQKRATKNDEDQEEKEQVKV